MVFLIGLGLLIPLVLHLFETLLKALDLLY
jgi:hypothetical protein